MEYEFEDFKIVDGENNIILSAPHCVEQFRDGKIKKAEPYTFYFVRDISQKINCHCIYKTKFHFNDPNYDEASTYKVQLVDYIKKNNIKLLIDVHSMRADRDSDICIGTGVGENIFDYDRYLKFMKDYLTKMGLNTTIDFPFNARFSNTVSAYVSKNAGIPCFQLEINNKFLYSTYPEYNVDLINDVFSYIFEAFIKRM